MTALWRVGSGTRAQLAVGPVDAGPQQLLAPELSLGDVLAGDPPLREAIAATYGEAVPAGARVLAPIDAQEVWAAGVTYLRSRDARMEESDTPDFYSLVYAADRPELFFKSTAERVRGPGEAIGVRADSSWDVPEPELAVVADASGRVVAYTIGNDVSSRSIEGENPLYLPQAKTYTGSCALGPCLVPVDAAGTLEDLRISVLIERGDQTRYADSVTAAQLKRTPQELIDWLFRALEFPRGVVLLTGTALVPDSDTTLEPGDQVTIRIDGLGELANPVERVGHAGGGG